MSRRRRARAEAKRARGAINRSRNAELRAAAQCRRVAARLAETGARAERLIREHMGASGLGTMAYLDLDVRMAVAVADHSEALKVAEAHNCERPGCPVAAALARGER